MLTIYPACFFKEENDHFSVIFPDLNYLATCGSTLEEAMAMAIDCLAGYIHWLKQDGDPIPTPSVLNEIDITTITNEIYSDSPYKEVFVNLVSVDVEEYAKKHFKKSVRKTLTIPAWLNATALEQGINFSQTLQEALLAKIKAHYFQ